MGEIVGEIAGDVGGKKNQNDDMIRMKAEALLFEAKRHLTETVTSHAEIQRFGSFKKMLEMKRNGLIVVNLLTERARVAEQGDALCVGRRMVGIIFLRPQSLIIE